MAFKGVLSGLGSIGHLNFVIGHLLLISSEISSR